MIIQIYPLQKKPDYFLSNLLAVEKKMPVLSMLKKLVDEFNIYAYIYFDFNLASLLH